VQCYSVCVFVCVCVCVCGALHDARIEEFGRSVSGEEGGGEKFATAN